MTKAITDLSWPLSRLGEGLFELAQRAGLSASNQDAVILPEPLRQQDSGDLDHWLMWASERLALEVESVKTSVADVSHFLRHVGPAILEIQSDNEDRHFLLLLKAKANHVYLIGPDLNRCRCPVSVLRDRLCQPYEASISVEIDHVLDLADVSKRQQAKVKALMLQERLAEYTLGGCWMLRMPPTSSFWQQLRQEHMPKRVMQLLIVLVALYGLEIADWGLMGQAALSGRLDFGWFSAWLLLAFTLIPLRLLNGWLDATFALDMGRIFKKRLLAGALRLNLETVKHQGVGQLLGCVMESQALESLALNGGFAVLMALIELGFAGWILANGAGGQLHVLLLIGWLLLTVVLIVRYFRRLRQWTTMRLDMTQDLVERMVGHRTCLAQEPKANRDNHEDHSLQTYLNSSKELDNAIVPIMGGLARGWLIVGLIGLAPAFIAGNTQASGLAIGMGGLLLANRALTGVAGGLAALARAAIAWSQVSTLFHSANKKTATEPFFAAMPNQEPHSTNSKLIDGSDLVFRYQPQGEAVLRGANLSIYPGERILLEGASGGGKSTLASLLVGLRTPTSGLLLLNGLDRYTLGEGWHRLATEAPQFHENHILTGTLAFNVLMGHQWPPSEADMQEAYEVCVELGLGELLERMPSGMMQMVGETGWQLSHGERSRIFLARALLQKAQLTILDESFAALDPESLDKCLNCAFNRTQTLMVIAHP